LIFISFFRTFDDDDAMKMMTTFTLATRNKYGLLL
jgi:hypothetical protein